MSSDELTARLAALTPAKRALLELKLQQSRAGVAGNLTIPRRTNRNAAALSFAQQRLWFLNQLEPESSVYNESRVVRLTGVLDVKALEESFNQILARHESLRTVIAMMDGNPVQQVNEQWAIDLPVIDLRARTESARSAEARQLIDETIRRPFDLANDLMLRAALLRLADQEHILVVAIHHIASDGWSSGILWREVAALYAALSSGDSPDLSDLPVQYSDYAAWQREWLQGELLDNQLSYWRKKLAGLSHLQLPTDRPRPAIQVYRGAKQGLVLSKELSRALKDLSRRQGVTLFMTLLAGFQALLHRYAGQQDVAVGSPIAGRNRAEIEGLIGFFVNTLVLRADLSGNPTFAEFLGRVREMCLGAYAHQDLPFEKLVEELQPERSLTHNPLFQVTFQLNNAPRALLKLPGLVTEDMDLDSGVSKFDLSMAMTDGGESLAARLQYNSDLFDDATIERMLGHFQTLLHGIVTNPNQPVSELPLLTESEKHQMLVEWNATQADYPKDECLHGLFEAQVAKTPDAVAVVFNERQLTYRELNDRANQVAHYLQKHGVGVDALVGICLERSIEMLVGLLGVLKAGGAYVPLDVAYPKERLSFMLEDAQPRVLLTEQKLLAGIDHPHTVCLDRDWHQIAKESTANPRQAISAQSLAYVIYTSGSTGKPKGVMISHRGLVNYLSWAKARYGAASGIGAPVHSSIGFDLTITALFTPLLTGRKVVLLPEDRAVGSLSTLLRSEGDFSLIKITPAHLEVLGQELSTDMLGGCARALIIGGEALTFEKLVLWSKHAPEVRLINEYGPTETVVGCCVYEIAPGFDVAGPVPIGRPIANTQLYLLDDHLQPVPVGVSGELHIGGDGLARGYLNRPELTREKFIANPFSSDPTSRLYKTGDLARYLPDGNIEFLGRIDNQVKIRGYRIELGEIETVLAQHLAVQQTVVIAREDSPGDRRLVAYAVVNPGINPSVKDLRSFLLQKLPEYMTPSAFVFLDSLPLTANGKVDRNALPAPDQGRPELDDTFVAPTTAIEESLANIWSEVLKVDRVGIHDNFFALGGHSLLATQVASRIRNACSIDLPLRDIFEGPTIHGLAQRVHGLREKQDAVQGRKITRVARQSYKVK